MHSKRLYYKLDYIPRYENWNVCKECFDSAPVKSIWKKKNLQLSQTESQVDKTLSSNISIPPQYNWSRVLYLNTLSEEELITSEGAFSNDDNCISVSHIHWLQLVSRHRITVILLHESPSDNFKQLTYLLWILSYLGQIFLTPSPIPWWHIKFPSPFSTPAALLFNPNL